MAKRVVRSLHLITVRTSHRCPELSYAQHTPHRISRFFLRRCRDVSIGVQGEAGGEVAQHAGDGLDSLGLSLPTAHNALSQLQVVSSCSPAGEYIALSTALHVGKGFSGKKPPPGSANSARASRFKHLKSKQSCGFQDRNRAGVLRFGLYGAWNMGSLRCRSGTSGIFYSLPPAWTLKFHQHML